MLSIFTEYVVDVEKMVADSIGSIGNRYCRAQLLCDACSSTGYQTCLGGSDEAIRSAFALVSDLSNVVKTYAGPEEDILFKLSDVQSRAVRMNLNLEEAANPAKLKRFQEVQGELSGILTQMTLISDHYPLLAESLDYQRLTTRLEEAENRINQARNNYIQAVRTYNATLRRFPQSMTAKLFGQYVRANFSIENEREISNAQRVQF